MAAVLDGLGLTILVTSIAGRRRSTPSARCSSGWPRTYWISHPLSSAREVWSWRIQELNGTDLLVSAAEWQEHSRFARRRRLPPRAHHDARNGHGPHQHHERPSLGSAAPRCTVGGGCEPRHCSADPRNRRAADLTTDERSNRVGEVRRIPPLRGRGLTLLKLKPGRRRWRFTPGIYASPVCKSASLAAREESHDPHPTRVSITARHHV
jgi:hypothetical protein